LGKLASPAMAYVSLTQPGAARGPHEHKRQTDYFFFLGLSSFRLYLWDNRPQSPTFGKHYILDIDKDTATAVVVPPGVVHAYKNTGTVGGLVFNAPDQLYGGWGRQEPIDEIRHENDPQSPFKIDD
jgi:dTDP-4-dehydrorhamnose 3,5-epimerase